MDLNRMPRGSKSVKTCSLDMAKKDGSVPHVSLFKLKHMRGWWPFTVNTDLEEIELAVSILITDLHKRLDRASIVSDEPVAQLFGVLVSVVPG